MTKKGGNVILRRRAVSEPDPPRYIPVLEEMKRRVDDYLERVDDEELRIALEDAGLEPDRIPTPADDPPSAYLDTPTILILAAGEEVAWEKKIGTPKQLLPIGDELVLSRIVRQVWEYNREPILVTHREDFAVGDASIYSPRSHDTIADTILHTRGIWGKQTIILLGDVVFGAATLDMIMAYRGAFTAFGNGAEIFAFSFHRADHEHFISTLETVIADPVCKKGAPWLIYRVYCGRNPAHSYIDKYSFEFAKDGTGDIDSLVEYRNMCKVVEDL